MIATLSAQRLLRVVLKSGDAAEVQTTDVLISGTFGRLRDVIQGPDGYLYIATSNRDGRNKPAIDDDRVLRLVPKQ